MKRGRATAAQLGAGREGVKKGEAEHPGGRAAARAGGGRPWGQGMGSCLARGTKGQGLQRPSSARSWVWRDRAGCWAAGPASP